MTRFVTTAAIVVLALAISGPSLLANQLSGEEKQVWTVIEESWEAIIAKDLGWTDKWVHADAVVWGTSYPMPRTRDAAKRWDQYNFQNSTTLASEFGLGAIVVHGDTAVAHYYYSLGNEDREGERKTTHGRCTDILVREGGAWKFLAWHCGDTPNDDDD